jgi:hypothetical protein
MLFGLGHDAFIGGDDEEGQINAAHARQHIFDEVAVAGHVDYAHFFFAQRQPGKAEVNCQGTRLLLRQPVGINAGEGLD